MWWQISAFPLLFCIMEGPNIKSSNPLPCWIWLLSFSLKPPILSMQQNIIQSSHLKNARKKPHTTQQKKKTLTLLWGSIRSNYLPSLGSAGDPLSTGTRIFLQKTNISAGSHPDALQARAWGVGAAGKRCCVSLKQQIAALHLQPSSLGQPHCAQAGDCQSVSGSETNRLLKRLS